MDIITLLTVIAFLLIAADMAGINLAKIALSTPDHFALSRRNVDRSVVIDITRFLASKLRSAREKIGKRNRWVSDIQTAIPVNVATAEGDSLTIVGDFVAVDILANRRNKCDPLSDNDDISITIKHG